MMTGDTSILAESSQNFIPATSPQQQQQQLTLDQAVLHLVRAKRILLQLLVAADSRPSRRRKTSQASAPTGACDACRKMKAKCNGVAGEVCARCKANGKPCRYSVHGKRGRKVGPMSTVSLLQSAYSEVEDALAGLPEPTQADNEFPELDAGDDDSELEGLVEVEESPLETLARFSTIAMKGPGGTTVANPLDSMSTLKGEVGSHALRSHGEHSISALYPDTDPALDPVTMGLLTTFDVDRLLDVYFTRLEPFFWHLDKRIHTTAFLRATSPFLLTAITAVAANFDPLSAHLTIPLAQHASLMADRATHFGFKSLQVVQAFAFMVHWRSNEGVRDRGYEWLGRSIRIATEIRLDRQLDRASLGSMSDAEFAIRDHDAQKTWMLLFCAEMSTSVQTGRPAALRAVGPIRGLTTPPVVGPNHPDYNVRAVVTLRRIACKFLETEVSKLPGARESFNRTWNDELASWSATFPELNEFLQVLYQNTRIVLTLFSLKLPGPVQPVLDECRAIGVRTAEIATNWPLDDHDPNNISRSPLAYASNFVVVNISYGCTLLLRIIGMRRGDPVQDEKDIQLCQRVADVLENTGRVHVDRKPLGLELSIHMKALINQLRTVPRTRPPSPLQKPVDFHAPYDFSIAPELNMHEDFSAMFNFEQYFVDNFTDTGEFGFFGSDQLGTELGADGLLL
ncbi:hypothetical protein T439DRAFT_321083 [Meredithblackwellia eburnea MCA 4105]